MENNIQEKINRKIEEMPKEVSAVIKKIPWAEKLTFLGKEYSLTISELDELYIETYLVLVGVLNPIEFSESIKEKLTLSADELSKLIEYMNKEIFKPLGEEIKKAFPDIDLDEDLEDEDTIQNSITNPPASKPISFAEQKLNEPHSLQKNTSTVPIPPGEKYSDPYREIA
ncbi:MAG TPA: hypothetical protein PK886_01865 [Candidatus Paceibacterota bacterium]|nr:hypothetical protein [Candidatus Paceibacterota bacterium]